MSEIAVADYQTHNGPWCLMTNGQVWRYNDTDPATPEQLLAMAEMLGKIARFNGATDGPPYSVAQHSVLVADLVPPDVRPYALLHDFHEAVLGDPITPVKYAMMDTALNDGERYAIRRAIGLPQRFADQRIYSGAGLGETTHIKHLGHIKQADSRALLLESRRLFPHSPGRRELFDELAYWTIDLPSLEHPIQPLPWDEAAAALKAEMRRVLPVFTKTDAGAERKAKAE